MKLSSFRQDTEEVLKLSVDLVTTTGIDDEFKKMTLQQIRELTVAKSNDSMERPVDTNACGVSINKAVLIDVKGLYDVTALQESGLLWWRL